MSDGAPDLIRRPARHCSQCTRSLPRKGMTSMTHDKYTELVLNAFGESDYSRFPDLRDLTESEKHAVARLMHDYCMDPTVQNVLRAAEHRYAVYMDESALANGEMRWFIDAADAMGFPSSFMEEIVRQTAVKARGKLVQEGYHFIELTSPAEHAGFYVFHTGAVDV